MGFFEKSKGKQRERKEKQQQIEKQNKTPAENQKMIDPTTEFEMMYGLSNTNPNTGNKNASEKEAIDENSLLEDIVKPLPKYKRLVNKKLTVILVENTEPILKEKVRIEELVNRIVKSDLVCVINYSNVICYTKILEKSELKSIPIFVTNDKIGNEACLFDALLILEKLVLSKYLVTEEKETERVCIDNIEIIGIGTCRDNTSKTTKEDALTSFYRVVFLKSISSKYFCFTEEDFLRAAEIGFHSIGSMSKKY